MDDIAAFLHRLGVPAWVVAIAATAYIAIDKLRLFHRPPKKSEREILSSDQVDFRKALMERLKEVERRCDGVQKELSECEKRHDDLAERLERMISAAQRAGLRWLIESSPVAPMPSLNIGDEI